jgi:hypothetical protein
MIDRSTVESCLRGVSFPAGKDDIVSSAVSNSCPSDTLGQIRSMELSRYSSKDDVLCHLGDISACS